jgi:2-oxoisovalerate dehydrogenase E1 component alpha subunit
MIVMNNGWGISTAHCTQHAVANTIDRGKPFGIPGEVVDGDDPVACWFAIDKAMHYCRTERRPYMLEARVARLNGHSSSSGAPRSDEPDCLELFEAKLAAAGLIDAETIERIHREAKEQADAAAEQAVREAKPKPEDVEKYTYAASPVDKVYPGDYTGLP